MNHIYLLPPLYFSCISYLSFSWFYRNSFLVQGLYHTPDNILPFGVKDEQHIMYPAQKSARIKNCFQLQPLKFNEGRCSDFNCVEAVWENHSTIWSLVRVSLERCKRSRQSAAQSRVSFYFKVWKNRCCSIMELTNMGSVFRGILFKLFFCVNFRIVWNIVCHWCNE